jgi:hypothetical protein
MPHSITLGPGRSGAGDLGQRIGSAMQTAREHDASSSCQRAIAEIVRLGVCVSILQCGMRYLAL